MWFPHQSVLSYHPSKEKQKEDKKTTRARKISNASSSWSPTLSQKPGILDLALDQALSDNTTQVPQNKSSVRDVCWIKNSSTVLCNSLQHISLS